MTSTLFKLVFLNSLLCVSVSFYLSFGVASGAGMRHKGDSLSGGKRRWQVVGGDEADVTNFPFQAVVVIHEGDVKMEKTCGGTIVSRSALITTASCVTESYKINRPTYELKYFTIYVGSTNKYDLRQNADKFRVGKIEVHPDFYTQRLDSLNGTNVVDLKQDLAAVEIKGYFRFNDYVQQVNLPNSDLTDNMTDMENSSIDFNVFGLSTSRNNNSNDLSNSVPIELFSAELYLVPYKPCFQRLFYKGYWIVFNVHLCAIGHERSICTGDYGGGLVYEVDTNIYILGVASMEYTTCSTEIGINVFTRVDTNLNFIQNFIGFDIKAAQSSGDFIHNKLVAQFYGTRLASLLILTLALKSRF